MSLLLQNGENTESNIKIDDALQQGREVTTWDTDGSLHIIKTLEEKYGLEKITSTEDADSDWSTEPQEPQNQEPLPDLQLSDIPEPLRQYVEDMSKNLQVPHAFIAVPLIFSYGTIIGSGVKIHPKLNDKTWAVPANTWAVLVADPSVKKTPCLDVGLKPLRAVDKYETEIYEQQYNDWKSSEAKLLAEKQGLTEAIKIKMKPRKASNTENTESLESLQDKLTKVSCLLESKPIRITPYTNDGTQEALVVLESQNKNGVAVVRDEFSGFVAKVEGNKDNGDKQFYMEGFNGTSAFKVNRVTRDAPSTKSHCISLIGTTQPKPMGHLIATMKNNPLSDDGFTQRLQLTVIHDSNELPSVVDIRPDPTAVVVVEEMALKIHQWVRNIVKKEPEGYISVNYDHEAQSASIDCLNKLTELGTSHRDNRFLLMHILKYPKLVNGLALIFHMIDCAHKKLSEPSLEVNKSNLDMAWRWISVLVVHANRLYKLDQTQNTGSIIALLNKIKNGEVTHGMTVRELKKHNWTYLKEEESVNEAIHVLTELGWCKVVKIKKDKKEKGRPSIILHLHPLLRGN